jgi:hypothetical protein
MMQSRLNISERNSLSALIGFLVTQLPQAQLIARHDAVVESTYQHKSPKLYMP